MMAVSMCWSISFCRGAHWKFCTMATLRVYQKKSHMALWPMVHVIIEGSKIMIKTPPTQQWDRVKLKRGLDIAGTRLKNRATNFKHG